ncbi:uncharacterized protein LOC114309741 [Camellia sinensis]|uniref:uncharacterized protein LOC114309741 n=1 Tax=Camellia sinensis TaxID=4442 RepID=UPI001036D224|nr:uncharacterized protein LOC114309741 [Camellia sinensis]
MSRASISMSNGQTVIKYCRANDEGVGMTISVPSHAHKELNEVGFCFSQKMLSSSVNGSNSNRLTYVNNNCWRCNKKVTTRISKTDRNKNKLFYSCNDFGGFVGWCLPMNSECKGHEIPREVPTVGEQVRCITEQLRAMTEQLRIHSTKMQKFIYICAS